MRRFITLITFAALFVTVPVMAQDTQNSVIPQPDCRQCHTCDVPTLEQPCLKSCPRTVMVHQTGRHGIDEAPDSLLLDELVAYYNPVLFIHKRHAQMAEMGGGCATCHHYSPTGEIPPCKECHTRAAEQADLQQPNLKGAYHRQCLSCHREWSHDTKCEICHTPVFSAVDMPVHNPDPTDIIGATHPTIEVPMKRVYETPYQPAKIVTFQHQEHIDLFGFRCVDCHSEENCGHCHDLERPAASTRTQEEVHAICSNCHQSDDCRKCHDTKERPGFSHNATGWPLNPYHNRLDCWSCHPKGKKVSRLNKMCASCHTGWSRETFQHAVTGLKLDDIHSELDCTDCHAERKFEEDPVCSDCHDDGRTAKTSPPGVMMKIKGK